MKVEDIERFHKITHEYKDAENAIESLNKRLKDGMIDRDYFQWIVKEAGREESSVLKALIEEAIAKTTKKLEDAKEQIDAFS